MKVSAHKCRNISHPFPIFAWLIIIFQGMVPWRKDAPSHMSISYGDNFFDVTGKGCKEHSRTEFLKNYRIIESHEFDLDITTVEFYEFFDKFRGKEYDRLQIVGLLLKALNIISFNKIGYNMRKLICNELIVAYLAEFHGFKFKDSDNFDLINTWCKVKGY